MKNKTMKTLTSPALLAAAFFILHSAYCISALRASEPRVIELWPEGVPGIREDAAPDKDTPGRSSAIHTPTMLFYPAPAAPQNANTAAAAANAARTAVIVCPGGGYAYLSMDNEGRKAAAWLNSIGVSAFVLKYRLKEYGQPEPLRDVLRAIRLVRSRASDYGVAPDRVGVLGFSAGGHLASCAATLFAHSDGETENEMDNISARPDFAALIYPVISMREDVTHKGSRENLLGANPSPDYLNLYSTDEQVTKNTPPVFLVAGTDDKTVPVENSLRFYLALRKAGVPVEMHLFQHGAHGFGMKTGADIGPVAGWPALCEAWMRFNGWLGGKIPNPKISNPK